MANVDSLGDKGSHRSSYGERSPSNSYPPHRGHEFWTWFKSPAVNYYLILLITSVLVIFGLVMVLSASSVELLAQGEDPFKRVITQAGLGVVGAVIMLVCIYALNPKLIQRLSYVFMLASLGLQALVFVPGIGVTVNGNLNWIKVGPVQLQPSEFVKLGLCLWLAFFFATYERRLKHAWVRWAEFLIVVGIALLLVVVVGQDLGTGLVILLIVFAAMLYGGVRMKYLLSLVVVGAAGVAGLVLTSPNRMRRFTAVYTGGSSAGDSYQTDLGLRGLAQGGYFGLGLGESRQKWSYLPEAETDFIFAIIGEEGGLMVTLALIFAYLLLGIGLHRLARHNKSRFVKIVTGTIMCWVMFQAIINIAVVVGLIPVVGLPLPFVSAGGSSLLVGLASIGIVLCFARNQPGARELLQPPWARFKKPSRRHIIITRPKSPRPSSQSESP